MFHLARLFFELTFPMFICSFILEFIFFVVLIQNL